MGRKLAGEYRDCAYCGADVYVQRFRIEKCKSGLFFCDPSHQNAWQGRNKIDYICKTCGNGFRMSASFVKYRNSTYCCIACRDADPDRHTQLIEMNVSQQRANEPNNLERAGYAILDRLGVEYEPQYLIGGKFCVDAFVPSAGLVIQFDGDYWHGNPATYPQPDERQRKRIRLDSSQDSYMATCGYRVIRIWESDMKSDLSGVTSLLRRATGSKNPG